LTPGDLNIGDIVELYIMVDGKKTIDIGRITRKRRTTFSLCYFYAQATVEMETGQQVSEGDGWIESNHHDELEYHHLIRVVTDEVKVRGHCRYDAHRYVWSDSWILILIISSAWYLLGEMPPFFLLSENPQTIEVFSNRHEREIQPDEWTPGSEARRNRRK
jgi:hypothetical protein